MAEGRHQQSSPMNVLPNAELRKLNQILGIIKDNQEDLSQRVAALEVSVRTSQGHNQPPSPTLGDTNGAAGVTGASPLPTSKDSQLSLQRDYETIKRGVEKVRLPEELLLLENNSGIKKEDCQNFNVVRSSPRYVETCIKILMEDSESVQEKLFTVLSAHIDFLQAEYAGIIVKGTFDQQTADTFKRLERNSMVFRGQALEHLRAAAEISAAQSAFQAKKPSRGPFNPFQRGRFTQGYRFDKGNIPRENNPATHDHE